jgi:hypothetical protein
VLRSCCSVVKTAAAYSSEAFMTNPLSARAGAGGAKVTWPAARLLRRCVGQGLQVQNDPHAGKEIDVFQWGCFLTAMLSTSILCSPSPPLSTSPPFRLLTDIRGIVYVAPRKAQIRTRRRRED